MVMNESKRELPGNDSGLKSWVGNVRSVDIANEMNFKKPKRQRGNEESS